MFCIVIMAWCVCVGSGGPGHSFWGYFLLTEAV
jgi:hypothetical protein